MLENKEVNNQTNQEVDTQPEEKEFSKKDVNIFIRDRVNELNKKHEAEIARLMAQQQATQQQVPQQQAQNNQMGYQQPNPQMVNPQMVNPQMVNPQQPPQLNPEQIKEIQENAIAHAQLKKKIDDAIEKDEEFKKLASTGNSIGPYVPMIFDDVKHLDNSPAVIKHLLKDKKDYELLMSQINQNVYDRVGRIRILNEISNKLSKNEEQPEPSKYDPIPDLSNSGSSDDNFNAVEYFRSTTR